MGTKLLVILTLTTIFLVAQSITVESFHYDVDAQAYKTKLKLHNLSVPLNGTFVIRWFEEYSNSTVLDLLAFSGMLYEYNMPNYKLAVKWRFDNSTLRFNAEVREWGMKSFGLSVVVYGTAFNVTAYAPVARINDTRDISAILYTIVFQRTGYVHINDLNVEEEGGLVYVRLSGFINKSEVIRRAHEVCIGCSRSIAALATLLDGNYQVYGGGFIEVEVDAFDNLVVVSGSGSWHMRGDIERFDSLIAWAMDAITALISDATFGVVDLPVGILMPPTAFGVPLIRAPGNASLSVLIVANGDTAEVYLKYKMHELKPAGDFAFVAQKEDGVERGASVNKLEPLLLVLAFVATAVGAFLFLRKIKT